MKDSRQGDHRFFLAERDTKKYVYKPIKDEYVNVMPEQFNFETADIVVE